MDLTLDRERLERVRREAAVVVDRPAVCRITGPGALTCLQGLFTNDLEKSGDESLVYGAMLTPKGMIVADAWIARLEEVGFRTIWYKRWCADTVFAYLERDGDPTIVEFLEMPPGGPGTKVT